MPPLTNVRTYIQFSKYGEVYNITYNGNKFMAMNAIKLAYGVKELSTLREYKVDNYLVLGDYTRN